VLCFDGDAAGGRAAARAAELALPMLAPERTLRLIALPSGEDPDSLVRAKGARAFQSMLDGARPLSECLFDMLREGIGDGTPEQRAAFRAKLEEAARLIPDRALAGEYRTVLLDRFFATRRKDRPRSGGSPVYNRSGSRQAAPARTGPRPATDAAAIAAERARILTAILLRHPVLLRDVEHAYAGLDLEPPLERLREVIAEWAIHAEVLDSGALMDHLDGFGLSTEMERILAGTPIPLPACASPAAMPAEAEEGWWHIFGFLNVDRLREEVDLAREDAARGLTGETERRLVARISALNKIRAGEPDATGLAAA
jgi:DNA primase